MRNGTGSCSPTCEALYEREMLYNPPLPAPACQSVSPSGRFRLLSPVDMRVVCIWSFVQKDFLGLFYAGSGGDEQRPKTSKLWTPASMIAVPDKDIAIHIHLISMSQLWKEASARLTCPR